MSALGGGVASGFAPTNIPAYLNMGANVWNINTIGIGNSYILCGALVADTYKTMLDLTTGGRLYALMIRNDAGSTEVLTVKITLDGLVIFEEATTFTGSSQGRNIISNLHHMNSGQYSFATPFDFNASLKIELKTDLAVTDSMIVVSNYVTK